jgi:hypothetical protein
MTRFVSDRIAVDSRFEEFLAGSTQVVRGAKVEPCATTPSTSRSSPGFPGAVQGAPRTPQGRTCRSASN